MTSKFGATAAAAAAAILCVAVLAIEFGGLSSGEGSAEASQGRGQAALPLSFVENQGQTDERVRYHANGPGYAFWFTPDSVVLSLVKGRGVALALRFVDGNTDVAVEGLDRAPGTVNYLRGDDPERWHTDLPTYGGVVYRELWPGVDMVLRGQGGKLKYEFRVRPGARVSDIRLAYEGADGLRLGEGGGLLVDTAVGELRDSAPVSYQVVDGERVPVDSRYLLDAAASEYGFAVGDEYRPDRELVIDPGVEYSTFLGGSSDEDGNAVAADSAGNAYITGSTQSTDFPTTTGAFDRSFGGGLHDVFVTKLNADGSGLAYSTYLGGSPTALPAGGTDDLEFGRSIAVDSSGNAYVVGQTSSSNFPTTSGAFDTSLTVGQNTATDGFVTKLNATGSGLVYSTYLGGPSRDDVRSIAVDGSGNAYVAGESGPDFPTTAGAFDTTAGGNGSNDVFAAKLNATGSQLVYSTYLGGGENDVAGEVKVDADGNAYVTGGTRSADFPTTAGSYDPTHNGGGFAELFDAFMTKLNPQGTGLVYSTFLGGSNIDRAGSLAIDAAGSAYVQGGTLSPEFPTTEGAFDRDPGPRRDGLQGTSDTFVTKLSPDGAALAYSTFMNQGAGGDIALDAANNAWLVGGVSEAEVADPANPVLTTADAAQPQYGGGASDAHVAQLNATGSQLLHGTFLGGTNSEGASAVALDTAGDLYVAGGTLSADFPTTAGAFDRTFAGNPSIFWGDAFVTKYDAAGDGGGAGGGGTEEPPPPSRATSSFSGRVDKNQTRTHTVSVGAAGPVELALDWTESRVNLHLRVRDPSGTVVFSDTSTAKPKAGSFSAAGAGDYSVEVVNTTRRQTNYSLTVIYPVASSSEPAPEPEPEPTPEPAPAGLSSLTVSPTSVTGGSSSTGTVTLDAAAPAGGASVALASSNTGAATVPSNVTIAAGATSASFPIATSAVSSSTSSTISATYGTLTRTATLTVNAPASSTDTVSISRAEYESDKRQLRVEASSSGSGATLRVYVTSTDEFIGTLSGGKGEFSWPSNPQSVTVKSSLGGSATRTVSAK